MESLAQSDTQLIPFLKWAGGKRWFVQKHSDYLPSSFNRYIEPFLGGGSVFFHLKPKRAILGDLNKDLVMAYTAIKEDHKSLTAALKKHKRQHSDEYYYKVRARNPTSNIERAARFIYLNRTCFNGIYRVNLKGKFNVPRGSKDTVILDSDDFSALSSQLESAQILNSDFEILIETAKTGDLVFADPPYTVRHNLNGFVKYNEKLFSWEDQIRLADALYRAKERGVKIVSTNANHESIRELYIEREFSIQSMSRYSSISAKSSSRNQFEELLVQSI